MTKIIFNYDIYYISDKDTFIFEKYNAFDIADNDNRELIKFKIYQCGKCIIEELYHCIDTTELNRIMESLINENIFYNNFSQIKFAVFKSDKGGCQNE